LWGSQSWLQPASSPARRSVSIAREDPEGIRFISQ